MNALFSFAVIATVTAGFLSVAPSVAQEVSLGKEIFQQRCSACHGPEGKGDSPVAELFKQRPKDLTLLSKENAGEFPFERVVQSVDGRSKIVAHGDSNMPIWGEYFMVQALADGRIDPKAARDIVAGRILSLAYYLQSIQAR